MFIERGINSGECINSLASRMKFTPNRKYLFATYISMTPEGNKKTDIVINDCYKNILDFGEFKLHLIWKESKDQHDITRLSKELYREKTDAILPYISTDIFIDLIFKIVEHFDNISVIEFRASREKEQIYHKYTASDSTDYLTEEIERLKDMEYEIYRVGFKVKNDITYHFEILRKGLLTYTSFINTKYIESQIREILDIIYRLTYEYYSLLPYIKHLSKLEYHKISGKQPVYNSILINFENELTEEIAIKLFNEITKDDFGIIRSEILKGSLKVNWHLYNKNDFSSTLIVFTPDPKNPRELVILPTNTKSKKDALKVYEIANTFARIKKVEIM